ncbi:MAG TPA: HAMP domain-containing sensor histidine kinase, partial [Ardenticatenaceae bacterium]|nr:HAMP domain-containing sensor histidine kinase [Ardenticatenaceae bacterium]
KALRPAVEQPGHEVVLAEGRTFAAAAAPLVGPGELKEAGWVVTLHDITRLKALDRLKSEFVSAVSHDLRAPLAAVAGYIYFLRKEALSEGGVDALDQIEAASARMSRLINDLLDLGRIESGVGFDREPLEVGPLLEAVREELQLLADAKYQQLVVQVAPETPPVEGDGDRLHQALVNLVHNAIKFTPVEGEIALRAEGVGRSLAITVSDTGPGIPLEDQPHIFDSFYRAARRPSQERDDPGGSGLGLAIVKGIVQQHGGRIAVDSGPGKGTTFRIILPALYLPALALTTGK